MGSDCETAFLEAVHVFCMILSIEACHFLEHHERSGLYIGQGECLL
jgi:hypothetical protein